MKGAEHMDPPMPSDATPTAAARSALHRPPEGPSLGQRLAAASGVAFVALLLPSVFLAQNRLPDVSPEQVLPWYAGHRAALVTPVLLEALAVLCLLLFVVRLCALLRAAPGGGEELPALALGAGVILVTVRFVTEAMTVAPAVAAVHQPDFGAVRALEDASHLLGHFSDLPLALLLGAASAALLRARLVARPIAWLGLATALAALVGGLGSIYETATGALAVGLMHQVANQALMLFALWMLATSIALLLRSRAARPALEPDVAPA